MNDAASLLAWGRDIVAARREGKPISHPLPNTATRPTATPQQLKDLTLSSNAIASKTATNGSSNNNTYRMNQQGLGNTTGSAHSSMSDTESYAADPAEMSSGEDVSTPTFAAGRGRQEERRRPAAPKASNETVMEAPEPLWQKLERLEDGRKLVRQVSAVTSPTKANATQSKGWNAADPTMTDVLPGARRAPTSDEPLMGRRRGATISGVSAASRPANQLLAAVTKKPADDAEGRLNIEAEMLLRHEEMALKQKLDSEEQHLTKLKGMSTRNREEFEAREAELLHELDRMPQVLAEAEARRLNKVRNEQGNATEETISKLEEILWLLESKLHELQSGEREQGLQVVQHVAAAAFARQCTDDVLQSLHHSLIGLKRLPSVLEELAAHANNVPDLRHKPLGGARATDGQGTQKSSTTARLNSLLGEATKHLERLPQFRLTRHTGEPLSPTSAPPGGGDDTTEMIAVVNEIIPLLHAFFREVEATLRERWTAEDSKFGEIFSLWKAAVSQLDFQRATMNEAHAALEEMAAERKEIAEAEAMYVRRQDTLRQLLAEAQGRNVALADKSSAMAAKVRQREDEAAQQRMQLASLRSEVTSMSQAKSRSERLALSHQQRAEEFRNASRKCRAEHDAIDQETSTLMRQCRQLELSEQDAVIATTRATEALQSRKGTQAAVLARVAELQSHLDKHDTELRSLQRQTQDAQRGLSEAERASALCQSTMRELEGEMHNAEEELANLRQEIARQANEYERQEAFLREIEEERNVARAVLLHHEEIRSGAEGAATQQELSAALEAAPPRGDGAPNHSSRSRSKQWHSTERSGSQPLEAFLTPPEELDESEPPLNWFPLDHNLHSERDVTRPLGGRNAPLLVQTMPRHFERDLDILISTREKQKGLIEYLEGGAEQHAMDDDDDAENSPPPREDEGNLQPSSHMSVFYPNGQRMSEDAAPPPFWQPSTTVTNVYHGTRPQQQERPRFEGTTGFHSSVRGGGTSTAGYQNPAYGYQNQNPAYDFATGAPRGGAELAESAFESPTDDEVKVPPWALSQAPHAAATKKSVIVYTPPASSAPSHSRGMSVLTNSSSAVSAAAAAAAVPTTRGKGAHQEGSTLQQRLSNVRDRLHQSLGESTKAAPQRKPFR